MKMPRSIRMRRREEFLSVRRKGRTSRGKYLVLSCLCDEAVPSWKFGFITPKRVGVAVVRNRVRRRLRAIVRGEGDRFLPGMYVVTIARWTAGEATFDELRTEWLGLAQRCGLLRAAGDGGAAVESGPIV
jgi:ribonuclease P protein component